MTKQYRQATREGKRYVEKEEKEKKEKAHAGEIIKTLNEFEQVHRISHIYEMAWKLFQKEECSHNFLIRLISSRFKHTVSAWKTIDIFNMTK